MKIKHCGREKATRLLHEISANAKKADSASRLTVYACFLQVLAIIHAHMTTNLEEVDGQRIVKLPKLVSDVLIHVDRNLTAIDTVEAVSAHFQSATIK